MNLWSKKLYCGWLRWRDFAYDLSTESFPFLVGHGTDSERIEGFRPVREAFIQRAWKQSESLVLRVVPDEEFLHTKANSKDVYVDYVYDYVVLQKISQKMHAVSGGSIMGWRFDSIELKYVAKVLKNKYQLF